MFVSNTAFHKISTNKCGTERWWTALISVTNNPYTVSLFIRAQKTKQQRKAVKDDSSNAAAAQYKAARSNESHFNDSYIPHSLYPLIPLTWVINAWDAVLWAKSKQQSCSDLRKSIWDANGAKTRHFNWVSASFSLRARHPLTIKANRSVCPATAGQTRLSARRSMLLMQIR